VRAELLAFAPQGVPVGLGEAAAARQPVWVGLQLAHKPEWHTYWKNSGDSGLPTTLEWTLPPGVIAGDIAWPIPKKIPIGSLANYGYEGTVLLPVPLTITPDFKPPLTGHTLDIKLKASWLVCRKECIPEEGEFALQIPLKGSTALNGAAFEAAFKAQPRPALTTQGILPDSVVRIDGNLLRFSVQGLPVELRGKTLDVFPETPEVIETAATPKQAWNGAEWTASIPLAPQRLNSPSLMPVVLASGGQGWRAELKVLGDWPKVAAGPGALPAPDATPKANAAAVAAAPAGGSGSLVLALLGALLGGLILNLMPCVFPVLAIKVVGFARHADDRRAHRLSGLAYTAGVILSFTALGALLLALRAAGESLGWGFQLQSPGVVAALAALFTLIGLNLAGLFEFGSFLPSSVASLQARHPVLDAFLTGVLAVAVASPCTAPFMGASLGLAVSLPAAQALAVFAITGPGAGAALPGRQPGAGGGARAAPPRRLDADLPPPDGLPDVCHRGLAGLGAGPADRDRRRRRPAGAAGQRRVRGVGAHAERPRPSGFRYVIHSRLRPVDAGDWPKYREICRFHAGIRLRRALAALGDGQGGQPAGIRPTGVRRFHRGLVRDLPVQQEDHARQRRRAGRLRREKGAPAARRLDAPRPRHHRRAERPGAQWGAGVCALPEGPCPGGAVGNPGRGRGALGIGRALTWGSVVPSLKWR
jgi:DsbC/DsbD-like thiol-disulfide interchange protein/cytochrome c biogenesis protein CcdA